MSDLHSMPPSPETSFKKETVKWVNANAVLQGVLGKLGADERKSIILRCDDFPLLQGTNDDFTEMFSSLLQMILQKKEDFPQIFLHIHCTKEEDLLTIPQKHVRYSIQFKTNITPCYNWMQAHEQKLSEVAAILHKYNGSLLVNQVHSKGCIFSLSLPGKHL